MQTACCRFWGRPITYAGYGERSSQDHARTHDNQWIFWLFHEKGTLRNPHADATLQEERKVTFASRLLEEHRSSDLCVTSACVPPRALPAAAQIELYGTAFLYCIEATVEKFHGRPPPPMPTDPTFLHPDNPHRNRSGAKQWRPVGDVGGGADWGQTVAVPLKTAAAGGFAGGAAGGGVAAGAAAKQQLNVDTASKARPQVFLLRQPARALRAQHSAVNTAWCPAYSLAFASKRLKTRSRITPSLSCTASRTAAGGSRSCGARRADGCRPL